MSGLKIKVSCDDDTRLWRYSNCYDFDGLTSFIGKTWSLTQFIAQYEDEEGDLITIANKQDLEDAVKFAIEDEKKKSLKIYVLHQKIRNVEVEEPQIEPQQTQKFGSVQEMVVDFLRNPQVKKLLPELFCVVVGSMQNGPVLTVDQIAEQFAVATANEQFEAISSHPLYRKYSAFIIPYICDRINGQQKLYKHFKLSTIKTWIHQLIDTLSQSLTEHQNISLSDLVIDLEYPSHTDSGKVIHFGVECDLCEEYPIVGDRYKCSMCPDWDCCAQCEPKHDHPLIKFKKSSKHHKNASFQGLSEVVAKSGKAELSDLECDCICGAKMEPVLAKDAYSKCKYVYCDGEDCKAEFMNEIVFHCPRGYDAVHHSNGFDLCRHCAQIKADSDRLKDAQIEQEDKKAAQEAVDEVEAEVQVQVEVEVKDEAVREESPELIVFEDEPQQNEDEVPLPAIVENDEFAFQGQLNQIMDIMNLNDDKDDRIKILLVENDGDVQIVLPLLFDKFIP